MAMRAARPCNHPGCAVLTRDGWCDKHRPMPRRGASAAWHGWYSLPAWKRRSAEQLIREPWCAECARRGIRTPATDADHIVPHRGDRDKFWHGELQSLCHRCHAAKTLAEQRADPLQKRVDFGG